MVSIRDVANKAKVSVATASRALNGSGYCSEKNKKLIEKAAQELGYIPNQYGRTLKDGSSNVVGIIVSDTTNEYYWNVISLLEEKLNKLHLKLMIVFSSEDPKKEEESFKTLISYKVSVIFFTPVSSANEKLISIALANGIKVIQVFRKIYDNIGAILNKDDVSTFIAGKYLKEHGYNKILLLDVLYAYLRYEDVFPSRTKGLEMLQDSCEYRVIHLNSNNFDKNELMYSINVFKPDSIICATNVIATTIIDFIKEGKIDKNTAFITFDDNVWFKLFDITSIKQNSTLFVSTLLDVIKKGDFNETIYIDSKLMERKLTLFK